QWQADALGILRQARYDSEDHLLSSQVLGAGIEQQEHYAHDTQGRLQRVEDSTGAQRELVRDDTGRLVATIDPLGRWTRYQPEPHGLNVIQAANTSKPLSMRYELDEHGHLQAVSADASDGLHAVRSTKYRRVIDDFGREVATLSPDSGREVRRFDTASRIVQVLQADGAIIDLEYDLADHLVRRTVTPHADSGAQAGGIPTEAGKPQTVRYVYESTRLIQISDPEQDERYAYDELARVASKTVTLRLNNGSFVTSPTRYRYDDQGLLAAQSLPDGSELQYERNGQRQVVALHRQTSPWAPFGWGRTVLVKDLQRDLVGLRHATYGNGVQGRWQRSREGMLARVVYTSPHQDPSALRTAFESLMSEARAQAASGQA